MTTIGPLQPIAAFKVKNDVPFGLDPDIICNNKDWFFSITHKD